MRFAQRNKSKHRKHDFAFAGLLSCAHDGCAITTELHKGKYVYCRRSYGHGRCDLPYMPESRLSDQLGSILKDIFVPEHFFTAIVESMSGDQARVQKQCAARITGAQQRLSALRTGMDQAYDDKLDGKLDEQMWTQKMRDWANRKWRWKPRCRDSKRPFRRKRANRATKFRTRESYLFSVLYAQSRGTRSTA